MTIKFQKLVTDAKIPTYAHPGDAGLDLYSCEDIVIAPGARHAVALGFALEIPHGFVARILDRSGMAIKNGIHCLAGVVDAGYRGEYKVIMINLGEEAYTIEKGDRVAQMLIQPVEICDIEEVEELSNSERGEGGFGASGKK
ncbi:MAG: dUTP diphosphatase [Candidatus Berkelbacteria bacterium]